MGRKEPRARRGCAVEQLETRTLLATINVGNYGAVPNDGKDDIAAIRSAINASAAGDTIQFASGTYNISDQVFLKGGGRSYKGSSGTILQGNPANHIFHIQEDNVRVEGFTFKGKPIMIDKPVRAMVSGVTIHNNVFQVNSTGSNRDAIVFTTGLANTVISNNRFENAPHGIYGYYWNKLTIANNDFINCSQGIHVDDHADTSRDMVIEQNLFSGIRDMAVEYQGGGYNTILQDNWYEKPRMTSNPDENTSTFAFSIVADRSHNTIARRNVIYAPERPDGKGVRIGFETGGDGTLVQNNWVYGINQVLANTDGYGTTSCTMRDNYYDNIRNASAGRGLTMINNGPQVDLKWLYNRGIAGRARRFTNPSSSTGGSSSTPTTAAPTTPAAPAPAAPTTPTTGTSVPAASGVTYLSDLSWTSAVNGSGPVEKDRSNGEISSGDGKTLTINGKTYSKGLGVHASSTITYNLGGKFSQFLTDIGMDDDAGNRGTATFQVWVDNVKVYESAKVTSSTAAQSIALNVAGKSTLKLVVTDGGDGKDWDHADWANARLSTSSTAAVTPTAAPAVVSGSATYLSNLAWASATNGWGAVEKDRSNGEQATGDGKALTIRGTTYSKGLGVHSNSSITYNLNGAYKTFLSDIGIDNEVGGKGTVKFLVYVDGVLKYDSGLVKGTDAVKALSVSVAGAKQLRLVVDSAGDGNVSDHGNWANARLQA